MRLLRMLLGKQASRRSECLIWKLRQFPKSDYVFLFDGDCNRDHSQNDAAELHFVAPANKIVRRNSELQNESSTKMGLVLDQ